jgi:hypothetical protein
MLFVTGDFSCNIRRNVANRNIVSAHLIHSLASETGAFNETDTVEWINKYTNRNSLHHEESVLNFTHQVREYYHTNDRFRKLWFFNPKFEWMPDEYMNIEGPVELADNTVIIAALSVRSAPGVSVQDANNRRFFLLPFTIVGIVKGASAPGVGHANPYVQQGLRGSNYNRNPDGSYLTGNSKCSPVSMYPDKPLICVCIEYS